jgi:hypothetical protein
MSLLFKDYDPKTAINDEDAQHHLSHAHLEFIRNFWLFWGMLCGTVLGLFLAKIWGI